MNSILPEFYRRTISLSKSLNFRIQIRVSEYKFYIVTWSCEFCKTLWLINSLYSFLCAFALDNHNQTISFRLFHPTIIWNSWSNRIFRIISFLKLLDILIKHNFQIKFGIPLNHDNFLKWTKPICSAVWTVWGISSTSRGRPSAFPPASMFISTVPYDFSDISYFYHSFAQRCIHIFSKVRYPKW